MEYLIENWSDDRVLYVEIHGDITLEDWAQICSEMHDRIAALQGTVHVIVNMLDMGKHPYNAIQIQKVMTWAQLHNLGWIVHLTNSRLVNILGVTTMQFFGRKYMNVDDLDQAMAFLADKDATLNV